MLWIISPWGGEAFAIPDQKYSLVTFTKRTFSRFRPLAILHSDQGRNFESALLQEVCNFMGITKTRTTSHHPVILSVTDKQSGKIGLFRITIIMNVLNCIQCFTLITRASENRIDKCPYNKDKRQIKIYHYYTLFLFFFETY